MVRACLHAQANDHGISTSLPNSSSINPQEKLNHYRGAALHALQFLQNPPKPQSNPGDGSGDSRSRLGTGRVGSVTGLTKMEQPCREQKSLSPVWRFSFR